MADEKESDLRFERERASVLAMRNAKGHMEKVLDRVRSLEFALEQAIGAMKHHKGYVGADVRLYAGGDKTLHNTIDDHIAAAQRALGSC